MDKGHGGIEVATVVSNTLDYYGIKDRLGYITSDNYGANDVLCNILAQELNR